MGVPSIDLRPLFWLAGFGAICAAILVVVGVPYGVWYVAQHLAWH